ncbi:MAG: uroporphyrinogen-III synthase, partial [Pseudomonadota bacterium]
QLDTIVKKAEAAACKPPAVLIVGQVVSLRDQLSWFEKKPFFGKKILITRPEAQALTFAELISGLGGEPVLFPTVEIVKEPDLSPLYAAFKNIESYDWIIFTSVNAVEIFFTELAVQHVDIRTLKGIRLCAIGPETKSRLIQRGLGVDVVPEQFRAEGLLDAVKEKMKLGQKVLLPRARNARPVLPEGLRNFGVLVNEIGLYCAAVPRSLDASVLEEILHGHMDIITFTSSSTVSNFAEIIGKENLAGLFSKATVACIGPITSATARNVGIPVAIEAAQYTVEGLLAAILMNS